MWVCAPTTARAGLGRRNRVPGACVPGPAAAAGCQTGPLRKTLAGPPGPTRLPGIFPNTSQDKCMRRGGRGGPPKTSVEENQVTSNAGGGKTQQEQGSPRKPSFTILPAPPASNREVQTRQRGRVCCEAPRPADGPARGGGSQTRPWRAAWRDDRSRHSLELGGWRGTRRGWQDVHRATRNPRREVTYSEPSAGPTPSSRRGSRASPCSVLGHLGRKDRRGERRRE